MDEATMDASRRTRLANERAYLAWWRGGLTSLAIAFISFGVVRRRQVDQAIARGGCAPLGNRVALGFGLVGVGLAVLVIVVVAVEA